MRASKGKGGIRYYDKVGMTTADDVNSITGGVNVGMKRGKIKNAQNPKLKDITEAKSVVVDHSEDDSAQELYVPKKTIKVNPIGINNSKTETSTENEQKKSA